MSALATRLDRWIPERRARRPVLMPSVLPLSRSWGEPFGVLLVEDNDDEIRTVQHTLRRAGLTDRPHVVRDGRAALDALLEPSPNAWPGRLTDVPDVILLDLGIPKVSGLDVLRQIKERYRVSDIPVVVLSGDDDEGTARACMNLGANMYIIKPMSYVQVMNVIVAVQEHWLAVKNFRGI